MRRKALKSGMTGLVCLLLLSGYTLAAEQIVLGSYSNTSRAEAALREARKHTDLPLSVVTVLSGSRTLYRLVAGPFDSAGEADRLLIRMKSYSPDAWVDRSGNRSEKKAPEESAAIVLGAFADRGAAEKFRGQLETDYRTRFIISETRSGDKTLFRVMTVFTSDMDALRRSFDFINQTHESAWVYHSPDPASSRELRLYDPQQSETTPKISEVVKTKKPAQIPDDLKAAPKPEPKTVVFDSKKSYKAKTQGGWVPPGFEELLEPQTTEIDVYFGSAFLTSTLATYTPTEITLLMPDEIMPHLGDVLDPQAVLEKLSGPMPTNAELNCLFEGQEDCGEIETDSVEVIFDDSRFRLDLFFNSQLLAVRDVGIDEFLPKSDGGLAFLNQLNATVNGQQGGSSSYNIGSSTTIAYRETRLLAISNVTREDDFTVDTLALEREFAGKLYQAGYFRSSPANLQFMTEQEFAGVTMSSSLDTRNDLDQSTGNDLQVFLETRSRVDLLKDGRLMSTAVYDAGNQIVDTSTLPGGAYDVLLRIRDSFGRTSEEVRFYVKTTQLPPVDNTLYFLDVGEVASRVEGDTLPRTTGESLVRAGVSRRLTRNFGGQVGVMAQEDEQMVELGLFHLGRSHELNVNVAAGSDSDRGVGLGGRFRIGPVTLQTNYRRTWVDETRFETSLFDLETTQATLNLSLPVAGGSLSVTGRYNERGIDEADRNIGFRYDFRSIPIGRSALDTDLQVTEDNGDIQALLTFRLQMDRDNWRSEASSQYYYDEKQIDDDREGFINNMATSWSDGDRFLSDINWGMRATNQRDDDTLESDFEVVSDYGRMLADVVYSRKNENLSWGASLNTNIIANRGTIRFGGREQARSALVMNVEGQADDAYFDVLVNGSPRGVARIGSKTVIGIPPYETYKVSLVPQGDSLVDFNNQVQSATLYPGNVVTMDWKVSQVLVAFGQLVGPDGEPVVNALIEGVTGIATTDDFGFFQAEIEAGTDTITARTRTSNCTASLPEYDGHETVVMFDAVECL